MVFALGAGKLFKLDNGGEFEETIIGESDGAFEPCLLGILLI